MGRSISLSVVLLLFTAIVSCELFAADISAHGYFRTRSAMFQDLDAQRPTGTNNSRFGLVQSNEISH
jgi:predicted carbohydrate-binding protein with CBM5 and CBM33 domain